MSRESSLTQKAYARIREDLLACRLPPGERLNIKDLADGLTVSLGAVREALSRLTSEGFVVAEARRGFRAAPISADDLQDLTQIRVIIEGLCVRRAIELGDVAWESQLVAAFHRLSKTPQHAPEDPTRLNDDYAAAHGSFHECLVSACDSPWLLRLRRMLYAQSERYRYLVIPLGSRQRDVVAEHGEILHEALARDADQAADLMARHLRRTTEYLAMSPAVDKRHAEAPRRKAPRAARVAVAAVEPKRKANTQAKGGVQLKTAGNRSGGPKAR